MSVQGRRGNASTSQLVTTSTRSVGLLQLATTPRQIQAINTFTTRRTPPSTSLVDIKERNTQLAESACDPSIGLILQR
ncbi:hypothetical protein PC129_g17967 [Phytophthora cactorum]|uniref:Uncharacterized protein n=1 Tax=Phytophthora cactorum TaxID=29920 RepID=A0A8T1HG55_9STRA|nr:hypothetical protein PC111_g21530 [Phytophthora cactorum]KAG2822093.1 hypothetical protein PC112_g11080 [Phytophthora cactorum]KAG2856512.1 hypothetical protein PC113_g11516 [Phytophthora cactorum]KAG2882489.1 hypothetical protein PC114_g21012 [Phytophthora cactorum]KAG2892718.1 hypothetical protein PC115_g18718 [Phytophthora cactorum]